MRIVRFEAEGRIAFGVLEGDTIKALAGAPWERIRTSGKKYAFASVKLLAPVAPPDVIAIGLNYRRHADESGFKYPPAPVIFLKLAGSVTGPETDILLPAMAPTEVDYECELALVIGRTCRSVSEADALKYVLGCTCGNDVSARDCQTRLDSQWARGKSFETFCPLGPWIETDVDPDDLAISCRVNGEVRQDSRTSLLVRGVDELVAWISNVMTLLPGDVILTGTPAGVGPLQPGDTVSVTIENIGTLTNRVVARG